MNSHLIEIIRRRRDDVHRRISELRSELAVLEARAEELETVLSASLANKKDAGALLAGVRIVSPPRIARGDKRTFADLLIEAVRELSDAGYDGAQRDAIFKLVRRTSPDAKGNTLRVMLERLVKQGRIVRIGNLYSLAASEL